MGATTIGRRQVLRSAALTAGGAAVATVGLAGPAGASDNRGKIEGSWLVDRQDEGGTAVRAVVSFTDGGVLITHDILPAGPPFTGSWEGRSRRRFQGTILSGFPGEAGPGSPGVTVEIHAEGRVEGDTISGTY